MPPQRRAVGLTRRRALQVTQRDARRLPRIPQHKAAHPCWGDRRRWAYRRFVEQVPVNKKRMLRLMREPQLRLKAKRTPTGSTPSPTPA